MTSRPVLTVAGATLFLTGVAVDFLPQEIAPALGLPVTPGAVLLLQLLAAAMLAMGAINWLSKGNPMGGIYSRPLALADFLLFGVGAVSLDRAVFRSALPPAFMGAAAVCTLFAVAFIWLLFFHDPVGKK